MAPAFSAATAELEPALRLARLNTEVERGLARRFGIRSIPSLMLLHKGREIARQSGAMPTTAIVAFAQRGLSHSRPGNRRSPSSGSTPFPHDRT
jgi:thioredoxin 2